MTLSIFRSRSLHSSLCEEEELRSDIEVRRYSSSAVDRYPYLFLLDRVGNRVRNSVEQDRRIIAQFG